MSLYHNIHCKIWNDDKFPFASSDCQLVFFHLLTTPMGTQFGLFKASIPALAAEKRWSVKRYRKALNEVLNLEMGKIDEHVQVVLIPRFLKYNPPHNPNVLISWSKTFRQLPNCDLKNEFLQILRTQINGMLSESFRESFKVHFENVLVTANATATASVKE